MYVSHYALIDSILLWGANLRSWAVISEGCCKLLLQMCLAKTFDELRVLTWKRTSSVLELEPTSHSIIEGHIKRWWFLYKVCSDLLAMDYTHLQPTDFGWVDIEGELFPSKNLNLLPDDLFKTCKCKTGCQKKACSCFKAEGQLKCTDYCLCVNCKNRWINSKYSLF